ncbi:hypothetical protein KR084_001899, partial [Drosophila pseudotakahashii]
MVETEILQLNDYCLEIILQYVDIIGRISFAHTCSRFRDVFLVWSRRGYANISITGVVEPRELTLLCLIPKSVRTLNLFADDLVSSFNDNYSRKKSHNAPSKFCNLIKGMENLEYVKVMQIHPHPITKLLLRALQDLPNLKQLHICVPKNFGKFHRLELISIDVEVSPRDLLQYCRSLSRLRTLILSEQVSSCNLREILELLPHLQELSFYVDRSNKSGLLACYRDPRKSLTIVLDYLARERALQVLRIKGPIVAEYEAKSLVNIKSLRALDCSFADPDLVKYLSALTSLQILRITFLHPIDISSAYLEVIRQCKDLRFLRIFDYNINPDFVWRAAKVLEEINSKNTLDLLIHSRHNSILLEELKSKAL